METALDRFWELITGAIALNPETFQIMESLPLGNQLAFSILLLAGLSQGIGQAIVLFINRVKPLRFILSLVIGSILFVASYFFWVVSIWSVSHLLFNLQVPFGVAFRTLGLAAAPLLLGFFIALPYLGVPIQFLLSLWNLLAFDVGFSIVTSLNQWEAFWCGILGWLVFQILQRTIGKPVAIFGHWLSNTVAGANLVTDIGGLEELVQAGLQKTAQKDSN